jgi:hypothetical protein
MVSLALCQISILDEYVTSSSGYIQIGTHRSVYIGVQLPTTCTYLYITWAVGYVLVQNTDLTYGC